MGTMSRVVREPCGLGAPDSNENLCKDFSRSRQILSASVGLTAYIQRAQYFPWQHRACEHACERLSPRKRVRQTLYAGTSCAAQVLNSTRLAWRCFKCVVTFQCVTCQSASSVSHAWPLCHASVVVSCRTSICSWRRLCQDMTVLPSYCARTPGSFMQKLLQFPPHSLSSSAFKHSVTYINVLIIDSTWRIVVDPGLNYDCPDKNS